VYVLQSGLVVNAYGNGAAAPFVLLYLHDVRGIPLATAGLASAANAAASIGASLLGGTVADRLGPKTTVLAGLALATAAFGAYPFVRHAWEAIALGAVLGTAAGGWLTGQSILLAALVPAELRHVAFAQQRVAANLGLGLGGLTGGLVAATSDARTFTVLFLLNAVTFAVYGLVVSRLRVPPAPVVATAGGYRVVFADRVLRRVLLVDVAVVAGGVALVNGLVPVYARNVVGLRETAIGVLFLVNSLLIVGGQLAVARAVEGHRRSHALALMATLFATCWLLVLGDSFAFLLAAFVVLSAAECVYDSVRSPLVADLAPPGLGGRYLAAAGFSWQVGFVIGPAAGAAILGARPHALWPVAAAVCLGAAATALQLPASTGVTPRRERVPRAARRLRSPR
jgi:MFS family permease